MKYILKYLPEDGQINVGTNHKKVKLFLCTIDTQIGEISPEATWVKEGDEFDEHEITAVYAVNVETISRTNKNKHVVIIGSGELYDGRVDDVISYWIEEPYQYGLSLIKKGEPYIIYYQIKGPCGHYH